MDQSARLLKIACERAASAGSKICTHQTSRFIYSRDKILLTPDELGEVDARSAKVIARFQLGMLQNFPPLGDIVRAKITPPDEARKIFQKLFGGGYPGGVHVKVREVTYGQTYMDIFDGKPGVDPQATNLGLFHAFVSPTGMTHYGFRAAGPASQNTAFKKEFLDRLHKGMGKFGIRSVDAEGHKEHMLDLIESGYKSRPAYIAEERKRFTTAADSILTRSDLTDTQRSYLADLKEAITNEQMAIPPMEHVVATLHSSDPLFLKEVLMAREQWDCTFHSLTSACES